MTGSQKGSRPNLEWPEQDIDNERERFYADLLSRLGPAQWVAIVPTPAPLGAVRRSIESDCGSALRSLAMPNDGVAWLCPFKELSEVLHELFLARRSELAFLAFQERPQAADITTALRDAKAHPADRLLLFDDGELIEARTNKPE